MVAIQLDIAAWETIRYQVSWELVNVFLHI